MAIDYKKLTEAQLVALKAGPDPTAAELAKLELDRRIDRRRFLRNFFFPNLWAVLGLILAVVAAYKK